jgi:hypothetical protein
VFIGTLLESYVDLAGALADADAGAKAARLFESEFGRIMLLTLLSRRRRWCCCTWSKACSG